MIDVYLLAGGGFLLEGNIGKFFVDTWEWEYVCVSVLDNEPICCVCEMFMFGSSRNSTKKEYNFVKQTTNILQ